MKLSQVLLIKFLPKKYPKGNMWRGKYRLVRKVTRADIQQTITALDIEEKNMFFLRHPYLKSEEYKEMEKHYRTFEKFLERIKQDRYENFIKNEKYRKIDFALPHTLQTTNSWE
ncbi:hypothetical protein PGB90_005006 [Kerria lacca]